MLDAKWNRKNTLPFPMNTTRKKPVDIRSDTLLIMVMSAPESLQQKNLELHHIFYLYCSTLIVSRSNFVSDHMQRSTLKLLQPFQESLQIEMVIPNVLRVLKQNRGMNILQICSRLARSLPCEKHF